MDQQRIKKISVNQRSEFKVQPQQKVYGRLRIEIGVVHYFAAFNIRVYSAVRGVFFAEYIIDQQRYTNVFDGFYTEIITKPHRVYEIAVKVTDRCCIGL